MNDIFLLPSQVKKLKTRERQEVSKQLAGKHQHHNLSSSTNAPKKKKTSKDPNHSERKKMKKAPIPDQELNGTTRFKVKLEKERSRTREEVAEAQHLVPPRSLFGTHNASNLPFPKQSRLATSNHKKETEKDHNFTPQRDDARPHNPINCNEPNPINRNKPTRRRRNK